MKFEDFNNFAVNYDIYFKIPFTFQSLVLSIWSIEFLKRDFLVLGLFFGLLALGILITIWKRYLVLILIILSIMIVSLTVPSYLLKIDEII